MVTDSIRNIKSMWEKGNVFASPGSGGNTFKVKGEDGGGYEKVNETLCVCVCMIGAEREERAQFTGTSCVAQLTMRARLS